MSAYTVDPATVQHGGRIVAGDDSLVGTIATIRGSLGGGGDAFGHDGIACAISELADQWHLWLTGGVSTTGEFAATLIGAGFAYESVNDAVRASAVPRP